ncbi:proliferating cell nuclear antigen [Dichomitus squalens]|uniref:DNA sliding clamp PCNA n=2 Tax=Dichomitus squalens TaxID=114155 RepID=A0A4Q9PDC7_9APHY|nr:proliferating cell nuclear antigen [Dichomitus squalens LYAD-421 SS1]EJF56052.1 proliferating cell nuclear antigen [Dichomitus squalens LYAD-421 SS1]TBU21965.1 proliferating cell nuclear antigen [Dichomitus squalens]TBU41039.1 proliferating cell nuclear antigen [Dichomitus squalens]TBU52854.1 proliferating cell nuclear antigen [Dichomitus squalens]
MLEAKLSEAALLKRLLDAVKELVSDANFECNEEGIQLQAMDNSHVALVSVKLYASGFKRYRCDRPLPLGVNLGSLTKVLKCAKDDDICTLKAGDDADILSLTYEAKSAYADRIAEYEMKLMDIDADQLGIPDTDYDASVTMPSSEFLRIVRDLSLLGESVRIEVSKEGIRFVSDGEAANGNILIKQNAEASGKKKGSIEMNSAVTLTFSLKYLVNFSKSSSLSKKVQLMMSNDVPLLVSYAFNQGHIRYYLAPKIGDD